MSEIKFNDNIAVSKLKPKKNRDNEKILDDLILYLLLAGRKKIHMNVTSDLELNKLKKQFKQLIDK